MKIIDDFLNRTTMYRLVLYYLIFLLVGEVFFQDPVRLLFSSALILVVCYGSNLIFAKWLRVITNGESVWISALILALIITPAKNVSELPFLIWASVWAMAAKYVFSYKRKHLFNPVAVGVFLPAIAWQMLGNRIPVGITWWVGNAQMMIPVILGGWLVIRKIRREHMALSFMGAAVVTILAFNFGSGTDLVSLLQKIFYHTPLLFFAFVMLTEPSSTPPTRNLRISYGILTGILFAPQIHVGPVYSTPELALLVGNVFSWLVSPKERLLLTLREKRQLTADCWDFLWESEEKIKFKAGQYLEWTLGHQNVDTRGVRRYFTLASSPTEERVRLGVKFYENSSSFKKALLNLEAGGQVYAGQLAGDFTLIKDREAKLVFMAGGIGITPFRSILKYLIDKGEQRDIVLLYGNKNEGEIIYRDIIEEAKVKAIYHSTETLGRIDEETIKREVPDFEERIFYLSGPHAMVESFELALKQLGVKRTNIKTDYFPGFV